MEQSKFASVHQEDNKTRTLSSDYFCLPLLVTLNSLGLLDQVLFMPAIIQPRSSQRTRRVSTINVASAIPSRRDLTRSATVAWRYVKCRIAREEVSGFEMQSDGLHWHHREILGGRKMVDAEGVPKHNIGIVNTLIAVGLDPGWEPFRGAP